MLYIKIYKSLEKLPRSWLGKSTKMYERTLDILTIRNHYNYMYKLKDDRKYLIYIYYLLYLDISMYNTIL